MNSIKKDIETIINEYNVKEAVEEIHDRYISHMKELLPQLSEMDKGVEELAKESTAPDSDTPDWLKSDIKRGMIWTLQYINKKLLNLMDKYIDRFDSLSDQETGEMFTYFSDGRVLHNLQALLEEMYGITPSESDLWDIIHMVLDNIQLDQWAVFFSKKDRAQKINIPMGENRSKYMDALQIYNHALTVIESWPGYEEIIYRVHGDLLDKMDRPKLKELLHNKLFNPKDSNDGKE